jgi:predicted Zn-dependent peptidase
VVDKLYERMDTVTPQNVMSAAQKYFTPEQRTVVVLKGAQQ